MLNFIRQSVESQQKLSLSEKDPGVPIESTVNTKRIPDLSEKWFSLNSI